MVPKRLGSKRYNDHGAPFIDGTGRLQVPSSGDVSMTRAERGLETRAMTGWRRGLHRAHKGVLFIFDELNLTPFPAEPAHALQEGEFPITGQSERSSGAMVRTQPVPCKFVMIAAGNLDGYRECNLHYGRVIRGYG